MRYRVKSRLISFFMAVALMLGMAGCGLVTGDTATATGSDAEQAQSDDSIDSENVSFDISPQDDFYGYVNANDLWNMDIIYGEETAGGFADVANEVQDDVDAIVKRVVSSDEEYEPGSSEQLIRDYYTQLFAENNDYQPFFDKIFSEIDEVDSIDGLVALAGELTDNYGINLLWSVDVEQNSYVPDEYCVSLSPYMNNLIDMKELYEDDSIQVKLRDTFIDYLTGFGISYDDAKERAESIVYYMIAVAAKTDFDSIENSDIEACTNPYSREELIALLSNIDVDNMLNAYGISDNPYEYWNVYLPKQLEEINTYLKDENLDMFKDYARCMLVYQYEAYAPENYLYYSKDDSDMTEEAAIAKVEKVMYEQVSELYYNQYYTSEYAEAMKVMENDIKGAYVDMIQGADWLSQEARDLFTQKFNNIEFYFGGQEKYQHKPEDADLIGSNPMETELNLAARAYSDSLSLIGQKPDNSKWAMVSYEVNAYYNPISNSIYITRAIMSEPFFSLNGDYYSNLGGLGAVIGHELSHAFDSMGVEFDSTGAYNPEWISDSDRASFQDLVSRVESYYDSQTLLEVYHVDGTRTVGENLADLGGVECVLSIARTDEEKISIFENYARIWCVLYKNTNVIAALKEDTHSPDLVRVNAVLSNFDDFYRIYDLKEGDGMYVSPEDRVVRW